MKIIHLNAQKMILVNEFNEKNKDNYHLSIFKNEDIYFVEYNYFPEFKPLFYLLGEPIELNLPEENDI